MGVLDKYLEKPKLYEILVPVSDNDGVKFEVSFHQLWDAKVVSISGGLSIFKPIKGVWEGNREGMIPVKVAATEQQMAEIAELTMEHYDQEAIMYYVVSPEVVIISRNKRV